MIEAMIRSANIQDAEAISSILNEADIAWSSSIVLDCLSAKDLIWVVEKNNIVIGLLIIRSIDVDMWEILQIAIEKSQLRRGYAKRLLEHAIDQAKKQQITNIQLELRQSNEAAFALYQKIGFKVVGVRKKYYQNGENALLMDLCI